MSEGEFPDLPPEGERLFDAMVRWRAIATTCVLGGFAAGFANLIVGGTGGPNGLIRGTAALALVLLAGAIITTFVAFGARRRFIAWYRENAD